MKLYIVILLIFLLPQNLTRATDHDSKIKKDFEEMVKRFCKMKMDEAPANIINEIKLLETPEYEPHLSEKSQAWLHEKFVQLEDQRDIDIASKFQFYKMPGAMSQILTQSFWYTIKGKKIPIEEMLDDIQSYWNEKEDPKVLIAPIGGGHLYWNWELETKQRKHGIIHVGIDSKTRLFWCYEADKGIYFPVGDILERIRAEIVQNNSLAGDLIGKGYIKKISLDGKRAHK